LKSIKAQIITQKQVEWVETDVSLPSDHILLEGVVSGISAGTETMWYNGTASALKSGRRSYPYTPGYEFIGRVAEIGSDITSNPNAYPRLSTLKTGDLVFAFKPHARWNTISEADLWTSVPAGAEPFDALGLALACTSLHAIHRSEIRVGDDAAVIGMGVLGFVLISCLNAAGAGRITAISRAETKRERARLFGANAGLDTGVIAAGNPIPAEALSDVVFECTGQPAGINLAMRAAQKQGKIIAAGFYTDPVPLDGELLFSKELTLYGVRASGASAPRGEFLRWPRAENLKLATEYLRRGYIGTGSIVTHEIKPANLEEAYHMIDTQAEPYGLIVIKW